MSIKITQKNKITDKLVKNYVLFADESFEIFGLSKLPLNSDSSAIKRSINSNKSKDKEFLIFNLNPTQKIILIKIKKKQSSSENEKKGAKFFSFIKSNSIFDVTLFEKNIYHTNSSNKLFVNEFLHGAQVKSYIFDKYKSKKKTEIFNINLCANSNFLNSNKNNRFESILEGLNFTKDLVSEPGNILHPDEYAKRLSLLKKFGLKVVIYDEKK